MWLVTLTTIGQSIEHTLRMKQSPMLYVLEVFQYAASEDIDLEADQVYDTLIGMISPQALWSAVIGQYNNVIMDIYKFVIFLHFPLLGLHFISFWVGSWVWGLSYRFSVLASVWVSDCCAGVCLGIRVRPAGFWVTFGLYYGCHLGRVRAVYMTDTNDWSNLVTNFNYQPAGLRL